MFVAVIEAEGTGSARRARTSTGSKEYIVTCAVFLDAKHHRNGVNFATRPHVLLLVLSTAISLRVD
jgi:hypothetical protein